ncbi:MAG: polyketide synthase, partial [bacterium]|nr:polyketide synthase [bacterium]
MKPVDRRRPPLFRVGLIKKSEHEHLLMADIHHIITDGTSAQVFEKEFMALYAGEELPPLRLQYKDYSQWQNKLMKSGKIKGQENYWLKQLEGEVPILNLPTDYPRPAVRQSDGAVVFFEVRNDLFERVKHLTSETGTTLYIVLLSTYYILLSRLAEQEDIVVGTPIAGRTHSDLQNIVGLFVNMLIM